LPPGVIVGFSLNLNEPPSKFSGEKFISSPASTGVFNTLTVSTVTDTAAFLYPFGKYDSILIPDICISGYCSM
jgi:hypothetical protein